MFVENITTIDMNISETYFTWSAIYGFFSLCRTSQKHILLDLQSMDSSLCVIHLRNMFYLICNLWILLSVSYISETCFTWSAIYGFYSLCHTSQKHVLLDLQSMDSSLCVIHLRNMFYLICNLWILLSVLYISETYFTWSAIYGFYSLCRTSQKHILLDLQSMDSSLCVVHLRNIFYLICNLWILLSVSYISETCFTWSAICGFYSVCCTSQKYIYLICNLWILLSVSYISETYLLDLQSMDSSLCVVHLRNIFTWSAIYGFYSLCCTSQKHVLLDLQSIDSTLCVVHLRNMFYLICNL